MDTDTLFTKSRWSAYSVLLVRALWPFVWLLGVSGIFTSNVAKHGLKGWGREGWGAVEGAEAKRKTFVHAKTKSSTQWTRSQTRSAVAAVTLWE